MNTPSVGARYRGECIPSCRSSRSERSSAGGVSSHYKYIPEHLPQRAKQLHATLRQNHNFCDFDPLPEQGVKTWTELAWVGSIHLFYVSRIDIHRI